MKVTVIPACQKSMASKFQLINTVSHEKAKPQEAILGVSYQTFDTCKNLMTEKTLPCIEMKITLVASLTMYIKIKNGCTFNMVGVGELFSHETVSITVKYCGL